MKDVVRKGFLVGLGITAMATSRLEKEVKGFLKENDITQEEAAKAAKSFLKDVERYQKKAVSALKKEMRAAEQHLKKEAAAVRKAASKKIVARQKRATAKK